MDGEAERFDKAEGSRSTPRHPDSRGGDPILHRARARGAADFRRCDLHWIAEERAMRLAQDGRRSGRAAHHRLSRLRPALAQGSQEAHRAHRNRTRPLHRVRAGGAAGPVAPPGPQGADAHAELEAGEALTDCAEARRHRDRLLARLPPERMRPRTRGEGQDAASLPEVQDEAVAAGEEPPAPLPRAASHLRQRADHVRANLVSVQKLLGHSNPKITAETYAHLALDYLLAEVNLLRFGVDHLAPVAKASQRVAAASTIRVTPELQSASPLEGEAGAPSLLPEGIPASEMAGCTGLEPVASGVTGRRYNQLN